MFTHKMDPLVRAELDKVWAQIKVAADRIATLEADKAAIEEKLDQLLAELDKAPERSTTPEQTQEFAPGHQPWSKRKAQRESKSKDPAFAERVLSATTRKAAKAAEAEIKTETPNAD